MARRQPDDIVPGLSDSPRSMPKSRQKTNMFWYVPDAFDGKTLELPSSAQSSPAVSRRSSEAQAGRKEDQERTQLPAPSPFAARAVDDEISIKPWTEEAKSSQNRLVIKNGRVVNDDHIVDADVYIEDGIIKQVGTNLMIPGGVRAIDAAGKLVIPGGVDTHTHMEMPTKGTKSSDDFYSGTKAALAGGTTTIIDFVMTHRGGGSILDTYESYRENADAKVCCDYALHVVVPQYDERTSHDLEVLVKEKGINSFKAYMAYSDTVMLEDDELYELMKRCKELGALTMVHAENGKVADKRAHELASKGIMGPEGHPMSRPEEVEAEAVSRAIMLADQAGAPLYVVHVMSRTAADEVSKARREGKVVIGEPIAAGLAITGEHYTHKCWRHAAGYVMSPPLRADPTTPQYLMRLLANGDLTCTGTDHCVFKANQKALGKDDFRDIPNGVNGVEDRMSVLWEKGVETGILDPSKFVAVTSTNAAKVFNIYPRKGRIAVGSDADIVIWNPREKRTISKETHHQNVDFNIFEGMVCHGVAEVVITGGRVVLDEDGLRVTQGAGRFVPTPAQCQYVYGRVAARDKARAAKEAAVEREPYSGPVVEIDKSAETAIRRAPNPIAGDDKNQAPTFHCRPPTSSGARHQQDSSFDFSGRQGAQIDDRKPIRTNIRTNQPPGGSSRMPWM